MKELAKEFDGRGEVKGYKFTQRHFDGKWYIYQVDHTEFGTQHFEVFKRVEKKANPPFAPEDFVRYPNSNAFGATAWTKSSLEEAQAVIANDLSNQSNEYNSLQDRESEKSEEED